MDEVSVAFGCPQNLREVYENDLMYALFWYSPGGSVKDRAALAIVEDAERRGELRPGGVVVEGTAGNTHREPEECHGDARSEC